MKLLREILFPLVAVVAAFLIGGILILIVGDNPLTAFGWLISSAFSYPVGIGYTLFYTTPLIFTGLAVAVAFRCGLLNIGAEGQLYVAAFAAAWIGLSAANLPMILLAPISCLIAILGGAFWGAIPGVLKARFGSHEVINTIMLNFIAVAILGYLTQYHYRTAGDPIMQTAQISPNAHVPRLGQFIPGMPEFIPLNFAFILALLACVFVYVFLWKTKFGYEIRATGLNPTAAEYGGIAPRKQIVVAMALSGALAGMVGIHEVLGYRYVYQDSFSANVGFTGIAVALLGRNHPLGVLFAAFFFGVLERGAIPIDAFTEKVSKDIVDILKALVILFVAGEAMFRVLFSKLGVMKEQ